MNQTLTTFALIAIIIQASAYTQPNPITNEPGQVSMNTGSPNAAAQSRGDQTIAPTPTDSSNNQQTKRVAFYYSYDVKRIIGWVKRSMPEVNDTEIIMMLSLWIWGFTVLNFICILISACCCHPTAKESFN
jgi:hypothetical protein